MLVLRWRSLLNSDRQFKSEENIAKIIGAEKETVASDSTLSRALEWLDPEQLKSLWGTKYNPDDPLRADRYTITRLYEMFRYG